MENKKQDGAKEAAIITITETTTAISEPAARLVEKSFAETQFAERSAIARFKDGKSR